ncbi:MAG: amidohydrolase family protein [Ignavibacteriales bacterium]|nr:amidohydrolase family protein [Ignavibacteriales bacterium]
MPHENLPDWERKPGVKGSLTPLSGSKYKMIDAHLHVVNFVQETPGYEILLRSMNKAGVEKAVIFGLPVVKQWAEFDREPPNYYLSNDSRCYYYQLTDILVYNFVNEMPTIEQNRFYPLLCGFNPTDKFAIRDVERTYNMFPGFWKGIGEVLLRHDDLTVFTYGEPPRANHKALIPIFEFAADRKLPVLIHQNVSSVSNPHYPIYLYELEEALRNHPNTVFVFAHCGISRRINVPFYYQMIERLLEQFPLLYMDISWIIFDEIICPSQVADKKWIELIEKHSERFCLGSDLVTRFERMGMELNRYDIFLDELSENARANVCYNTAEKIYGGKNE